MKQTHSPGGIDSLRRMHRLRRIVAWLVLVVMGIAVTSVALAAVRGTSTQGRGMVSGGVGFAERQALHEPAGPPQGRIPQCAARRLPDERRDDLNPWPVTAATRSGAFLSDMRVKITDAEQRTVFEGSLDGPWPAAGARRWSARPSAGPTVVGAW